MARKKAVPTPHITGPWSKTDIKYLKKFFGNAPTRELAAELDRPYTATRKKAGRLGLHKTKRHMRTLGKKV